MSNTKIIAFEGIDGSGKTVQFKKLASWLTVCGHSVVLKEYPVYDSFFGRTIGELLSGQGELNANMIDPKSMALWFALDRFHDLKDYNLDDYDYMLINRYALSNMVYQSMRSVEEGFSFVDWAYALEHDVFKIPKPDVYLLFDVDERVAEKNIHKKGYREYVGDSLDVYEESKNMQRNCRKRYLECAERFDNIVKINCMQDGMLMDEDAIAHLTINAIKERGLI